MWVTLAISLTTISVILLYVTNKHQKFLNKTISKKWRIISWVGLFVALFSWLQNYTSSAAIFIWLFVSSVVLILIPFISLIVTPDKSKRVIQGKR